MPRPRLKPTEEQRNLVKSMAAAGVDHAHIALKIGIRSPKTLRKYFRNELDTGFSDANYKVTATLYKMATSGEYPAATIYWDKTRSGQRERREMPPPFVVSRDPGGLPHASA